jgi:hypothetical protein
MPKYNLINEPFAESSGFKSKAKKSMTRKELRRKQINAAREKRYFVRVYAFKEQSEKVEKRVQAPLQSTLSDKMWLYLEVNKLVKEGRLIDVFFII